MNVFYLDSEYTNGNLYRGDLIEISVLAETSGQIFHSYIKCRNKLPPFVRNLCNITDEELETIGLPFNRVIDDLIKFIDQEEGQPIIITHGGVDIPLIIANCMKNGYNWRRLAKYIFMDSVKILQKKGYEKPGLDSFSMRKGHSAIEDVKILQHVFNNYVVNTKSVVSFKEILEEEIITIPTKAVT